MCRHVAHLGRPTSLSALLLDPPHGLLHQSYAPRRQRHGRMNADGFGVGWWVDGVVARYRRDRPLWSEASLPSFGPTVRSGCVLAAVRSASAGMPGGEAACAPFLLAGRVLLSHNGFVPEVGEALGDLVSSCELASIGSTVDSAFVGALVQQRLAAGAPLGQALAQTVRLVADRVPGARLNLLAADGQELAATRCGDTLVVRASAGGIVVASEPGDDEPGWQDVPEHSLVTATGDGVAVTTL